MNFMELYLLNRANQVNASLSTSGIDGGFPEPVASTDAGSVPNSAHTVPVISTCCYREHSESTSWSSSYSGQQTTPDTGLQYGGDSNNNQYFWFALGDASPEYDKNQSYYHPYAGGDDNNRPGKTTLSFAKYNDWQRTQYRPQYNGSNENYAPFFANVVFIKNTTGSDITKTFYTAGSSGYSSATYSGSGMSLGVPNNTSKQATTGITWTSLYNYNGSSYAFTTSASVTFPANKTSVVLWTNSFRYWTSFSSGAHWHGRSNWKQIDSVFDGTGLVPDHKLTAVAYQGRNNNWAANAPWQVWVECGNTLGDN